MSISAENKICLTGLDRNNKLREVDVDLIVWHKIRDWRGCEEKALEWLRLQIKLFSNRHPARSSLSHIISSIAVVESTIPSRGQQPIPAQSEVRDIYQVIYSNDNFGSLRTVGRRGH